MDITLSWLVKTSSISLLWAESLTKYVSYSVLLLTGKETMRHGLMDNPCLCRRARRDKYGFWEKQRYFLPKTLRRISSFSITTYIH